jgi:phage terminase small subunit
MRVLNDQQRLFVQYFVMGWGKTNATQAARMAGYGAPDADPNALKQAAYGLRRNPKIVAAIAEESRMMLRSAGAEAVQAVLRAASDPEHKDHMAAVKMILERVDPVTQNVSVTHKIVDETEEALEELRALRAAGVPRERMVELFGGNGLVRLERLEAEALYRHADAAKVIDAVPSQVGAEERGADDGQE